MSLRMYWHTTGAAYRFAPSLDEEFSNDFNFPVSIEPHPYYQRRFQNKLGVLERIKYRLNNMLRKIMK